MVLWRRNFMSKGSEGGRVLRVACRAVLYVAILSTLRLSGFAQLTTGAITGTVTDQTGAAVPGATVTLKNTETGVSRSALSSETGKYEARSLPNGTYEISAS